jgi:hypothetical protein
LAIAADGSYSTIHSKDVRETHDLMEHDGRGYYFREKSEQWDIGTDEENNAVVLIPRYPNRLLIKPASADMYNVQKLSAEQRKKIKALRAAHTAGPVEIHCFSS